MNSKSPLIRPDQIEQAILLIRGQRVMLDRDLASLYGVETKNLNRAVRRNLDRFPADFMIQLTADEAEALRFQFGTLKRGQHYKYLPFAFTQEGVAMLSSVLRSPRAVQVNIAIMRVFVRLRETLALHKELAHKLAELERKIESHDAGIRTLFEAIHHLTTPPAKPNREIGFHIKEDGVPYRVKRK
jgi:phage regulator Rha-like protein